MVTWKGKMELNATKIMDRDGQNGALDFGRKMVLFPPCWKKYW